jgi:hypothetical protein
MDVNSIRAALRTAILAIPSVLTAVVDRVYPGERATVEGASYPCVNFRIGEGGHPGQYTKFGELRVTIYVWNRGSGYDVPHALMKAIKDTLHMTVITSGNTRGGCRCVMEPTEIYDAISQVHGVVTNWVIKGFDK